jgi:tetratricopeptide (TPR) repeat protein
MIRRDYILRMVEEFVRALSRIRSFKRKENWKAAQDEIQKELNQLFGGNVSGVENLSETEILGRLIETDSAFVVREKIFMLATLLKESGDAARQNGDTQRASAIYLKALHLVLDLLKREGLIDLPEYTPKIEVFVESLGDETLPPSTYAMLMHYYESIGNFAKAEDYLYALRETTEESRELNQFARSFYDRLMLKDDLQLERGGLPRAEIEEERTRLIS